MIKNASELSILILRKKKFFSARKTFSDFNIVKKKIMKRKIKFILKK